MPGCGTLPISSPQGLARDVLTESRQTGLKARRGNFAAGRRQDLSPVPKQNAEPRTSL